MTLANHLVAFVKAPRLGRVKTRLAADIGPVAAWTFYRRTTREILARLEGGGRWRTWLAVTPDDAGAAPGVWPDGWRRIGQGRGDLGRRMARMVHILPPGPVVIVGTDVPGLDAGHVERAFRSLRRHDAVLGPAADGGYWLVGLRRRPRCPQIFESVRWSTAWALEDTLANARGLDVALLDVLADIDDGAALARWRQAQTATGARRH